MDRDEVWRTIDSERLGVADLLEQLSDEEWAQPSLCTGWTVRDVAAHLSLAPQTSVGSAVVEFVRARGSFNRMIHETAKRHATRRPEELIAELRAIAGTRRTALGQKLLDALMDILVHGQDIVLPLGRHREMPPEAARTSATHVWTRGFPFHAQKRLRGLRLTATDVDWSAGEGAGVEGPIDAILLLLTGRPAALERLTGAGAADLRARLSPRPANGTV